MRFRILNKAKKKPILKELEPYGIKAKKLNYLVLQQGNRIRIFSGLISKDELLKLARIINIDSVGLELAIIKNKKLKFNTHTLDFLKGQSLKV